MGRRKLAVRASGLGLAACASLMLAAAGGTAAATASVHLARGLETGFGGHEFESTDAADRRFLFDRARDAGAGIVRLEVSWRGVVAETPPANPRNPADPSYHFSVVDAAVRGASARGLRIMLTVAGTPGWAEGPHRPDSAPSGSWRPDPAALGSFAHALATRYSGRFAPSGHRALPRVRYYEAWNEANLDTYLSPQWDGNRPLGARLYAKMLNSFYSHIKAVDRSDVVISAGFSPYGDPPPGPRTRPLKFVRDLLCLRGRTALAPTACPRPAKFDVLGVHAISLTGGPTRSAINPDDVTAADLGHVRKVLRAAERHGTLGTGGAHPIWTTELWHLSPSRKQQAYWLEQALYEVWKYGSSVAMNLQVRDSGENPTGHVRQSPGVLFTNGTPKPSFKAFHFPFVVHQSHGRLRAWLKAPRSGRLTIQHKVGDRWHSVTSASVERGSVYLGRLPSQSRGLFRAVVEGKKSLPWRHG